MRKKFSILFLLAVFILSFVGEGLAGSRGGYKSSSGAVRVRGYFRKNGTYVRPHIRTSPDRNPYNNFSFPGNYNPNTGKTTPGNPDTYLRNYYNKNMESFSIINSPVSSNAIQTMDAAKKSMSAPVSVKTKQNYDIDELFGERNVLPNNRKGVFSLEDLIQ